jgi:hypothetical protein
MEILKFALHICAMHTLVWSAAHATTRAALVKPYVDRARFSMTSITAACFGWPNRALYTYDLPPHRGPRSPLLNMMDISSSIHRRLLGKRNGGGVKRK